MNSVNTFENNSTIEDDFCEDDMEDDTGTDESQSYDYSQLVDDAQMLGADDSQVASSNSTSSLTTVKSPPKISSKSPHTCLLCNKTFISKYLMQQHVTAIHEKKRFSCSHCSETFAYRSGRTRHFHSVHQKLRFLCTLCDMNYTSRETAQMHVKNKHKKDEDEIDFYLKKMSGDKINVATGGTAFNHNTTTTHNDIPLSFSSRGKDLLPFKHRMLIKQENSPQVEDTGAFTSLVQSYENGFGLSPSSYLGDKSAAAVLSLDHFSTPHKPQNSPSRAETSVQQIPVTLSTSLGAQQAPSAGALQSIVNFNNANNNENSNLGNGSGSGPGPGLGNGATSSATSTPKHRWPCTMCDKTFAYNAGRSKHVRSVHMRVRYRCTLCNSLYTTKDYATQHVNSAHCIKTKLPSDYVEQICDKNGENGTGGGAVVKNAAAAHHGEHHSTTHKTRLHKSHVVSRATPNQQTLSEDSYNNSHDQNNYDEENLYNYSGLSLMSNEEMGYKIDKSIIEKSIIDNSNNENSSHNNERLINSGPLSLSTSLGAPNNLPFHCLQCGVGYPTQETLAYHVSLEHEEQKLPCDYCGQCWLRPASLIGHLKQAHPDISYRCTLCDNVFQCPSLGSHHIEEAHQCDPSHFLIHVPTSIASN